MKTLPTNRHEWLVAMLVLAVIAPHRQRDLAQRKAEAFVLEARMPPDEVLFSQDVATQLLFRPADPCPPLFGRKLFRDLRTMIRRHARELGLQRDESPLGPAQLETLSSRRENRGRPAAIIPFPG